MWGEDEGAPARLSYPSLKFKEGCYVVSYWGSIDVFQSEKLLEVVMDIDSWVILHMNHF
jgi:hypothetical protein